MSCQWQPQAKAAKKAEKWGGQGGNVRENGVLVALLKNDYTEQNCIKG